MREDTMKQFQKKMAALILGGLTALGATAENSASMVRRSATALWVWPAFHWNMSRASRA